MTDRELMQQALDALEEAADHVYCPGDDDAIGVARKALRARLAQPEHKPADVFLFLLGEGELDGAKFGERHPTERGNYWWRKHLRAVLAQPEPEPVAWFMEGTFEDGTPSFTQVCETDPEFYVPLYTAPPQREWQGLTDEEIESTWQRNLFETYIRKGDVRTLGRAIEAKLWEKNT